ncbi:hypothetical protein VL06_18855 [Rossellomorea marisflavi]|nr:hypothetical protein VL06_18855 [Rossellomorea marisflavi]
MVRVFSLFHAQFISLIGVQDEGSCGKKSLCETPGDAGEAHVLPAESEVLHGNLGRYKEPNLTVSVIKL